MSDVATTIASTAESRSAPAIADAIGQLVARGALSAGDHLPTVRALADEMNVSPSTVSDAWRILRTHGLIETDRRRGTTVRTSAATTTGRSWHVPVAPGTLELDLSTGTPDPHLLPALGPALQRVHDALAVSSYLDDPTVAELDQHLRSSWPFTPETLTIVDGAQDALDRLIGAIVSFGDTVVVESPTFPPLLDMLALAGARVIGVPLDDDGPDPTAFADALAHGPVAVFVQPRAHNPTGTNLSADRRDTLAALLADRDIIVVEDDHSGAVAGAPLHSTGGARPERTVLIHSFSKSHGPDLRLAAIGGAHEPIAALIRRRQLGPSWSSRLIQRVLLDLLEDAHVTKTVEHAGAEYSRRRQRLVEALREHGIDTNRQGSGLNLWIPVGRESDAVVALAAHGIGVAPGSPFDVDAAEAHHIRVTLSSLRDDEQIDATAALLASAAGITAGSTATR